MTTGYERTRALMDAGDLLELIRVSTGNEVSDALRQEARRILRHYPSNMEIAWVAEANVSGNMDMPLLDPGAVPRELRTGYRR